MKILITGATGFVGTSLTQAFLKNGHEVVVLTRTPQRAREIFGSAPTFIQGDLENSTPDLTRLGTVDAVVHLAGENVGGGRWTPAVKNRIIRSRTLGTENLVSALKRLAISPRVFVGASAIGIYGSRGDEVLPESAAAGSGFLAKVCVNWEKAMQNLPEDTRTVILRFGVVLDADGGALEKILPPFRAGVGGRIGDGRHWMSWIHRDDLVRLIQDAIGKTKYKGTLNAVAPEPVSNRKFTEVLGHALHRPTVVTVPVFALKLMFGEMADETILASQRVEPALLKSLGFPFTYPTLESALTEIVGG